MIPTQTKPAATPHSPHTPGPWHVQCLGANKDGYPHWHEYCVRAENNVHLATVGSVDRFYEASNEANARLIASAPALRESLAECVAALNQICPEYIEAVKNRDEWAAKEHAGQHPGPGFCRAQKERWSENAKAALHKARSLTT